MKNELKALELVKSANLEQYIDQKAQDELVKRITAELTARDVKANAAQGSAYSRGLMDGQREAVFNARRCHIGCD